MSGRVVDPCSPAPWTVRPFEDDVPLIGIADGKGNEVGFAYVFSEDPKAMAEHPEVKPRPRAELVQDLELICRLRNQTPADRPPKPLHPLPWHLKRGRGWKDELVISVLDGDNQEVLTVHEDAQARVDLVWIVAMTMWVWRD